MSTQDYKNWVAAGRPFALAHPVADYRDQLWAAGWGRTDVGTLGNEDHLQAELPQDHCPFSHTGWPEANEYPFVCALDAMHHPDRGLDVGPLVTHWLFEALHGRTPWVKYINWQGKQYDVRRNWEPRPISGHYDHAHVSFRTDWTHKGIGDFVVVKKGSTMSTSATGRDVWAEVIDAQSEEYKQPASEFLKWEITNARALERLEAAVKALSEAAGPRSDVPGSPVDPRVLADALATNGTFIDRLATAIAFKLPEPATLDQVVQLLKDLTIETKIS